jgi:enoyl-CoA hydratase/carnithine racemase
MIPAQVKTEDFLLFETRGRVAYLTFNRPQQLNALSWPLMEALEQKLKQLERDPKVGVIVLRGAGRCFSSGYDLHETDPTKMIKGEGPADGTHEPKGVPEYGRSCARAYQLRYRHLEFVEAGRRASSWLCLGRRQHARPGVRSHHHGG